MVSLREFARGSDRPQTMTEIMSEEIIERTEYKGHQENIRQMRFISIIEKIPAPEGGICPKEALKALAHRKRSW